MAPAASQAPGPPCVRAAPTCGDEWVGSRPCTTDGLPLIGPTRTPGVHVATGHGMWGVVHGPLTGRLLAEQVVTGCESPLLRPFRPTR